MHSLNDAFEKDAAGALQRGNYPYGEFPKRNGGAVLR